MPNEKTSLADVGEFIIQHLPTSVWFVTFCWFRGEEKKKRAVFLRKSFLFSLFRLK
jgi:hypothetical protein